MGEQEPETKDWLGKDVKDSICNNFNIDADELTTIGNTPDARKCK